MEKLITSLHHDNRTSTESMRQNINFPTIKAKRDPGTTMRALAWHGAGKVTVETVPRVDITDPGDALIRVTSTTVCGSDLHLYHHEFQGLADGDILGHEAVGVVEKVGPGVKGLTPGDRVVVSCVIACNNCDYCKRGEFGCCDGTNPSKEQEKLFGHRTAALFGYSGLMGGYEGGQADYLRVPIADTNCLKVPPSLADEQVLGLADVLCTSWHCCELGGIGQGDTVAIWGAGPIGLATAQWAKFRGARKVVVIDDIPYRLNLARERLQCDVIDFSKEDVVHALQAAIPGGQDVSCDCSAGFRAPKSLLHKVERAVRLETDQPQIVNEMIATTRKAGRIALIADYYAYTNHFNLGGFMEKGLRMAGGQVWVQKYWRQILGWIEEGRVDGAWLFTHTLPFYRAAEAYAMFDAKDDKCIKILLKP